MLNIGRPKVECRYCIPVDKLRKRQYYYLHKSRSHNHLYIDSGRWLWNNLIDKKCRRLENLSSHRKSQHKERIEGYLYFYSFVEGSWRSKSNQLGTDNFGGQIEFRKFRI